MEREEITSIAELIAYVKEKIKEAKQEKREAYQKVVEGSDVADNTREFNYNLGLQSAYEDVLLTYLLSVNQHEK